MLPNFVSRYSTANLFHALRRVFEGPFSGMKEVCYAVAKMTEDIVLCLVSYGARHNKGL